MPQTVSQDRSGQDRFTSHPSIGEAADGGRPFPISILKNAHPPQPRDGSLDSRREKKNQQLLAREQTPTNPPKKKTKKEKKKERNRRRDGLTKGEQFHLVLTPPLSSLSSLILLLHLLSSHPLPRIFVCISKGLVPNLDLSVVSVESPAFLGLNIQPKRKEEKKSHGLLILRSFSFILSRL